MEAQGVRPVNRVFSSAGSPGASPIMPLLLQNLPLLNNHRSVVGNRIQNGVENNPACPGAKQ
jgi:hypothetical protein